MKIEQTPFHKHICWHEDRQLWGVNCRAPGRGARWRDYYRIREQARHPGQCWPMAVGEYLEHPTSHTVRWHLTRSSLPMPTRYEGRFLAELAMQIETAAGRACRLVKVTTEMIAEYKGKK